MHLSCCFFVTSVSVVTAALHVSDAVSKKREQAPRWYITNAELAALSSYMRGRLTLDKVGMQHIECLPSSATATIPTEWQSAAVTGADTSRYLCHSAAQCTRPYCLPHTCLFVFLTPWCCMLQVNAAIDEVAMYADSNHRWMHAVRAHQVSRIPADDRKRAQEMFHSIEVRTLACDQVPLTGARHQSYHVYPLACTDHSCYSCK